MARARARRDPTRPSRRRRQVPIAMSQLEFVCLVMDEVLNGLAVSCDRILRVWSDMNEVRRAWAGSEAGGVGGPLVLARRLAVRAPGGGAGAAAPISDGRERKWSV